MYCPKCGANNPEGTQYCSACQSQLPAAPAQPAAPAPPAGSMYSQMYPIQKKTNGLTTASLVLGLCGAVTCGITSVVGIILGIVGLVNVKNSKGTQSGEGLAIAGIGISVIIIGAVAYMSANIVNFFKGADWQPSGMCLAHMKQLGSALQIYTVDYNGKLPPASRWCDAIYPTKISKLDVFKCSAAPNLNCAYGFNSAMSGKETATCPNAGGTVLLFESNKGWNACGGREAMLPQPRHKIGGTYLLMDGQATMLPGNLDSAFDWNVSSKNKPASRP